MLREKYENYLEHKGYNKKDLFMLRRICYSANHKEDIIILLRLSSENR